MSIAALTPVFANAGGELLTHPGGYAVLHYSTGAANVEALAALLTQTGALLVARGWNHLLSNALELPVLSTAAKDWIVTNWLGGRMVRPYTVHVAVVQPIDALSHYSMSEIQSQVGSITRYYHFATTSAAHAFIAARLA